MSLGKWGDFTFVFFLFLQFSSVGLTFFLFFFLAKKKTTHLNLISVSIVFFKEIYTTEVLDF